LTTAETLPPDLVFLDLHMPEMNGLQVLERLRALPGLEEIPVVLLTASRSPEVVTQAAKYGVHDYLSKPAQPRQDPRKGGQVPRLTGAADGIGHGGADVGVP
jgi:CheY-like chemotaxis protein